MARKGESKTGPAFWLVVAGVAAGIAAAIYFRRRTVRDRAQIPPGLRKLEDAVLDALRADDVLRERGVDVAAIAPGIMELTGTVENEEEAHHAVAIVQSVDGVRTVLNRLDLTSHDRLRRRPVAAGESGVGSRWYGMSVGMGRRRQGKSTDPTQRDDHADMLDQSLEPDAEEAMADVVQERLEREARTNEVS
ncbi:MAG: BON domain-containing protein [Gemmatimonadota bacterium]